MFMKEKGVVIVTEKVLAKLGMTQEEFAERWQKDSAWREEMMQYARPATEQPHDPLVEEQLAAFEKAGV